MKKLIVFAISIVITLPVFARGYNGLYKSPSYNTRSYGYTNPSSTTVRGYSTRSGTYVQPYQRTMPNNTKMDNYSTRGNFNPYTGRPGTRNPYAY